MHFKVGLLFFVLCQSAQAEFFAGLELRFGGQTVEAAELAHGDTVARGYAAEGVATADGIGSGG